MLDRIIDDSYPAVVRRVIVPLTVARLAANGVYRFAPPFLATIARGLDVDIAELGVALALTEASGLASPLVGRLIDRVSRRASMAFGLAGIAVGAVVAGISTGIVMFTIGLLVLAVTKIVFDVGMMSWTADHVPYARRGRIVGLIEMSWALGLLVGVTSLGLVAAVTSWRWSYVVGAIAVVVAAGALLSRLDADRPSPTSRDPDAAVTTRLRPSGWAAVVSLFALMAGAQALFVTFGPWLEDVFGFGTAGLAAVTFGIGALELVASGTSAARTDRWGKERSVIRGTMIMVPSGLVLALFDQQLGVGLLALGLFIASFEFALVSAIPIGAELVPGAPGRGIGTMIACGTIGRAVATVPATRLYDRYGLVPAAVLGVSFAAIAALAMVVRQHIVRSGANR